MYFERFWRTMHHLSIKGVGPLFFLVGGFLVFFTLKPSSMVFFGQRSAEDIAVAGGVGIVSLFVIGLAAILFLVCPLVSWFLLYRDQHRRGVIVLFPPFAMSLASVYAWILG